MAAVFPTTTIRTTTVAVVAPAPSVSTTTIAPIATTIPITTTQAAPAPTTSTTPVFIPVVAPSSSITTTQNFVITTQQPIATTQPPISTTTFLNTTSFNTTSTNITSSTNTSSIVTTTSTTSNISSSSSTTSINPATVSIYNAGDAASSNNGSSSGPMAGWKIGVIAGSIVGAILLAGLTFIFCRWCRHRRHRVPLPPPVKEMSYADTARRAEAMIGAGGTGPRSPISPTGAYPLGGGIARRTSSNSMNQQRLLHRQSSFYVNPLATPSSYGDSPPDISPAINPVEDGAVRVGMPLAESPEGSDTSPASPRMELPGLAPMKPRLSPINTSTPTMEKSPSIPDEMAASTSNQSVGSQPVYSSIASSGKPRRVSSVDRLRMEAGFQPERSPSIPSLSNSNSIPSAFIISGKEPLATHDETHDDDHEDLSNQQPSRSYSGLSNGSANGAHGNITPPSPSRMSSPYPASPYIPSSPSHNDRYSGLYQQFPTSPRPPSSQLSIGSRSYTRVGPVGGAPHQGRHIQLEMPRLLGSTSPIPDRSDPTEAMMFAAGLGRYPTFNPNSNPTDQALSSPQSPHKRQTSGSLPYPDYPSLNGHGR